MSKAQLEPTDLDYTIVEALTGKFGEVVRDHYRTRPTGRNTVLEILNALAATAAFIIAGTHDPGAAGFFHKALENQIAELDANPPAATAVHP